MPLEVVAFDWGGTLVEDPGLYPGPMAHWPVVAAVPGAAEALAALVPHYRLVVATNADESAAALVLAALARVGLADPFEAVFSSADLGVAKPDAAFYKAMTDQLDVSPAAVVTVGDNFLNDVAGARAAGLQAIWLDRRALPERRPAALWTPAAAGSPPGAPVPADTLRIRRLSELPAALDQLSCTP